jgi:phage terminase large subunit-like protein
MQLVKLASQYQIKKVGFDRWAASQIMEKAHKEFRIPVEPVGMGYKSMSEPSKMFERMTLAHEFDHNDNPVLNWMFGNTVFTEDPAGNIGMRRNEDRRQHLPSTEVESSAHAQPFSPEDHTDEEGANLPEVWSPLRPLKYQ